MSFRLNLWKHQHIEELVTRIEDQFRTRFSKKRGPTSTKSRGVRSKYLVKEGARARVVTCFTSDLASLTIQGGTFFANDLLPRSTWPEAALSNFVPEENLNEDHVVVNSLKRSLVQSFVSTGTNGCSAKASVRIARVWK